MSRRTKSGSIYKRGRVWWIKFYHRHKPLYESSHSQDPEDAERLLKRRQGEIATGKFSGFGPERIRVVELFEDLEQEYKTHQRKSLKQLKPRVAHLRPLAELRVADLTTLHVRGYITQRIREEAQNATINRELQILKRALTLGAECDPPKVLRVPHIALLPERNVRTGFLDDAQYLRLRNELPDYLKPLFVTAYHTGNRLGELRYLRWTQVDFERAQIRLNPGETKNDEGRVLPIYGEMRHWLEMQLAVRDTKYPRCPWVFHHEGNLIVDFRKAWASATKRAGLFGIVFHDLRRSAVRNMREAGIPENVAMKISGHKTRAVFDRYNIVASRDIQAAAKKMEQRHEESLKKIAAKQEQEPDTKALQ